VKDTVVDALDWYVAIVTSDICELVMFPVIARSTVPSLDVVAGTVVVNGKGVGVGVGVDIGVEVGIGVTIGIVVGAGVGLGVGVGGTVGLGVGVGVGVGFTVIVTALEAGDVTGEEASSVTLQVTECEPKAAV
jgi:hypothetical protein